MKIQNNNNFIIYKVENIINGKNYIGATTDSLHQRKLDHCEKSRRNVGTKFHKALRANSPDVFTWEILEDVDNIDELAKREQFYIKKFDTIKNGYNSDRGGGFKKSIYMFDLYGNFVQKFDSLVSASNAINVNKKNLSHTCYSVNKRLGNNL